MVPSVEVGLDGRLEQLIVEGFASLFEGVDLVKDLCFALRILLRELRLATALLPLVVVQLVGVVEP